MTVHSTREFRHAHASADPAFPHVGYVALPGLLSPGEAATLSREVVDALTDAFGCLSTEPNDLGGISGTTFPSP
jgi:hypothetical protein